MEYFRTLNLGREPFSNSPDPGLFYETKQHLEVLQQLEISIRLKRGLNVVTGDVGTGKTTISRQLIQKLTHDPDIQYALILDPAFPSETDFLKCILKFFTETEFVALDINDYKEELKNFLFHHGVEKKKTLVLIIDEGQKLPVFCLEVLRELLNYETNDQKLLQIVIFAQKEFNSLIRPLENFKDRINYQFSLQPLGFKETMGLIRFRLNQSAEQGRKPPGFTLLGFYAIFKNTRGYPRKIINLCHHIILLLIVEDKHKADFFFVRRCARKIQMESNLKIGLFPIAVSVLLIASSMYFFNFPDVGRWVSALSAKIPSASKSDGVAQKKTLPEPAEVKGNESNPENISVKPEPAGPALAALSETIANPGIGRETDKPESNPVMPEILGRLKVTHNATLFQMMHNIYGSFREAYVKKLLSFNREIKNVNFIHEGTVLRFPVIKNNPNPWDMDAYCILLEKSDSFEIAYTKAKEFQTEHWHTRIFHQWHEKTGFVFFVVVNRYFDTLKQAQAFKSMHDKIKHGTSIRVKHLVPES